MAKTVNSKSRRVPKQVGEVVVKAGNAPQMGGFGHFYAGHELAKPATNADGTKVYQTASGKQFRVKKMSS